MVNALLGLLSYLLPAKRGSCAAEDQGDSKESNVHFNPHLQREQCGKRQARSLCRCPMRSVPAAFLESNELKALSSPLAADPPDPLQSAEVHRFDSALYDHEFALALTLLRTESDGSLLRRPGRRIYERSEQRCVDPIASVRGARAPVAFALGLSGTGPTNALLV